MSGRDVLALSFRVIGLVFAASALVVATVTLVFVLRADQLTGTVIEQSQLQNSISFMPASEQTGILYYPVIRYRGSDGGVRQFTGPRGRSDPQYEIGQRVPILVAASDPREARLATPMGVWGTAMILAGIALVFFLVSLAAPLGFGGLRRG